MVEESDSNHSEEQIKEFRRILVAVDTSSHSLAALEAAAHLAQKMEANIHGLFVHEELWQKIGRLPTMRTINELTGHDEELEKRSLDKQIELLKKRLKRRIDSISREYNLSHSWESVKGNVEEAILQAAEDADLITIGRRGSSFPQKKKLGSSAKAIIRKADKPILILKRGLKLGESIMVVYDGSRESQRCLRMAISMAKRNESHLNILVLDNEPKTDRDRDKNLEDTVEQSDVPIQVQFMHSPDIWGFTNAVNRRGAGLLIMPKHQPLLEEHLETVIFQLQCPVLLMNNN